MNAAMRIGALLVAATALVASAATPKKATPAGAAVRVMKSDPPMACEELGDVSGRSEGMGEKVDRIEWAKTDARNQTADLGGNYFRWDSLDDTAAIVVTGTAFRCPIDATDDDSSAPAPSAPANSTDSTVPASADGAPTN